MTNKKSTDSRRKLLKSIAAGSGAVVAGKSLPESWSKPVIDSVMIPAHAATTDDNESGGPEATTTSATCILPPNCYEIGVEQYMKWPGGTGPSAGDTPVYSDSLCTEQQSTGTWSPHVVASDIDSAKELLISTCPASDAEFYSQDDAEIGLDGCSLYFCDS